MLYYVLLFLREIMWGVLLMLIWRVSWRFCAFHAVRTLSFHLQRLFYWTCKDSSLIRMLPFPPTPNKQRYLKSQNTLMYAWAVLYDRTGKYQYIKMPSIFKYMMFRTSLLVSKWSNKTVLNAIKMEGVLKSPLLSLSVHHPLHVRVWRSTTNFIRV